MRRAVVALLIVAGCGGDDASALDAGGDGGDDPCAAATLSVDDFYRCRSRLTCALLEDCRATDTAHLDCDDLPLELLGTSATERRRVEASIADGRATWDGVAAAACLAGVAARRCETFELEVADRVACSGVIGNRADDQPCARDTDCASPSATCMVPPEQLGCANAICWRAPLLGESCRGARCRPGDHCVDVDQLNGTSICRSGAIDQACDVDGDCDVGLFCLDGLANQTAVGRCFPVRAEAVPCHTDRECAGELACVGETALGAGRCRDLRAIPAVCDDDFVCFGYRYCDLAGLLTGACQRAPDVGDACGDLDGFPGFCGTELVCDDGRCVAPGRRGDRCVTMPDGLLGPLSCNRGLYCDDLLTGATVGTCKALQPDGEQCGFGQGPVCASGSCDAGVCVAEPVCVGA